MLNKANEAPNGLRRRAYPVGASITGLVSHFYDGPVFISLAKAVAQAHSRLFPNEPYKDLRTLQVIALALTDLIPMYWRDARTGEQHQLTEPELAAAQFTKAVMDVLLVPQKRFEVALDTMQVASLDQARVSLTLRQSPQQPASAR